MEANPDVPVLGDATCDSTTMKCTIASHEASKLDLACWANFKLIGIMHAEEDEKYSLELRDCTCGSTLAKKIDPIGTTR